MQHRFSCLARVTGIIIAVALPAAALAATPPSIRYKGKIYYRVTSTIKTQNTGDKVCALIKKTCIGYTDTGTNNVCKAFHPGAKSLVSTSGSKNGFYCNGAPQKGIACEKVKNTCEVCPTCNANATCATDISNQYREMYVECGNPPKSSSSSSSSSKKTTSSSSSSAYPFGPYPGMYACDFYQQTKKVVTCGMVKAADTFCAVAMQSRFAKAVECNNNGRIVCVKPCVTNPKELPLKSCAYDPERRRGYQAAPLDFCTVKK